MTTFTPSRSRPADAEGSGLREPRVTVRIELPSGARIGPGKIALLEEIARNGSISAAGRAMRMSYRRAWELIEDLNRNLGAQVVSTAAGGAGGGGARLTLAGEKLVRSYRAIESGAGEAAQPHFEFLASDFGPKE